MPFFNRILATFATAAALTAGAAHAETLCGQATPNTSVCVYPELGSMSLYSPGRNVSFPVGASFSTTVAGGITYAGNADIGYIAGMADGTRLALVVAPGDLGLLYYLAVDGWRPWPGSGWMRLAPPPSVGPIAAGVSN
jgi:hypothetical protein